MSAAAKSGACPICGKPTVKRYRPFCSKRCADVDLGKWLGEGYTIPAVEPPDDWPEDGLGGGSGDDDDPQVH